MGKKKFYLIFGLIVMAIILSSGCVEKPIEKITELPFVESEGVLDKIKVSEEENISSEAIVLQLDKLCSGEKECKEFCQDNRGRCEGYCKANNKDDLCRIFFPSEQKEQIEKPLERKPVLKNLGITIEPWDKITMRAGDFLFENKNYVDNKIFTEFAYEIVNEKGEKLLPEIGFNVPVGPKVVSPIDGFIIDVTFYEPSQDYLVSMKTDESSSWIVGFEHIYNLRVKIGDKIWAGQELAEVSPSYGKTEFGNVEINVWIGGQNIIKYCPFEFLDDSIKPLYKEKIHQLARDWEEFIGKNVYSQERWVAPG